MIGPLSRWWSNRHVEVYTVHEQPEPAADRIDRAEALVFVRDGFSWAALIFGPLWLIAQRAWLPLGLYFATSFIAGALSQLVGAPPSWTMLVGLAVNAVLGFEASSIKRWSLDRAGWTDHGTVSGRGLAECERRFLETWLPQQPVLARGGQGIPASTETVSAKAASAAPWRSLFGSKA